MLPRSNKFRIYLLFSVRFCAVVLFIVNLAYQQVVAPPPKKKTKEI